MSGEEGNATPRNGRMTESKMTTATLGSILELQRGYDLPTSQMKPGNVPVAGSNGVIGYHDTSRADAPAITIGRSGSAGKVHYYDNPIWPHNTSLFVTDFKGNDPLYVYYLLSSLDFSNYCGSSVVPSLNRNVIYPILVDYHAEIDEQRRVVGVLSAIDRKIALNRKRIATLEAMAKEIYDYWFVQFDFPDAHGRPYKSSGGAMVYNPDLKREIPKGWEAKSVNDCGAFFRGVGYSKADERARGTNTVLVMRGNNISNGQIVDDSDRVFIDKSLVSAEQLMDRFSVLFAMSSGSKEHVGKAAVYYDYPAKAAFGAFCSKFVPQPQYRYMMFCFLASETYRAFVKRICGGTGINNMKSEHFDVPLFAVPHDEALLHKFNDMAEQAYSQIYNCTQENAKLIGLRDFLLPVLMNGQVKVG